MYGGVSFRTKCSRLVEYIQECGFHRLVRGRCPLQLSWFSGGGQLNVLGPVRHVWVLLRWGDGFLRRRGLRSGRYLLRYQ